MSEALSHLRTVTAVPLTCESFAPFGEVVSHRGTDRRHYLALPFDRTADANRTMMWVSCVETPRRLPLRIERLERHPYSAQTFIPLAVSRYLIVVAPQAEGGQPDTAGLQAFIAASREGVCYRRRVWHHGLTVLDTPAEFAILMSMRGEGDDEFADLREAVRIEDSAHQPSDIEG